jgi:hypothetical protein
VEAGARALLDWRPRRAPSAPAGARARRRGRPPGVAAATDAPRRIFLDIKSALENVLRIDPPFQKGSADRALGRWYFKVPGLFGGSKKKSEDHLRTSLTYDPNSTASHWFLAETLFDEDKDAEAREELRRTIAAPIDPDWEPEDREFKKLAEERLARR